MLKKETDDEEYEDLTNSRNYTKIYKTEHDYIIKIVKVWKTIRWWGIWLLFYK